MSMLKQSPSRNQRSKGFKVKHFLQICLFLAISIWLIKHLKNSYDEKRDEKTSEKLKTDKEMLKLGRKHLVPRINEESSGVESVGDKTELEEEIKPEDIEDDGRGGGDDEIDGHDLRAEEEESEEVEDLIDVDDRDRDSVGEEQENEEKGNNQLNEDERKSREATEENYKGDDASSSVVHSTRTVRTEFESAGLRKIKVVIEMIDRGDMKGTQRDYKFDSTNLAIGVKCNETAAEERGNLSSTLPGGTDK